MCEIESIRGEAYNICWEWTPSGQCPKSSIGMSISKGTQAGK